ncbi:motility associated factor glycosyltransferase family protein [Salibacterium sp. K-3]
MDNESLLRKKNNTLYQKYKQAIQNGEMPYESVNTKDGQMSIKIPVNEKHVLLHSKFAPYREAEALYEEYREQIQEYDHIFFYGLGMGYHVETFIKHHPEMSYTIYEPDFTAFLSHVEYKKLNYFAINNLITKPQIHSLQQWLSNYIMNSNKRVLLVMLPAYKRIFPDDYNSFLKIFEECLQHVKRTVHTNKRFEKFWAVNSFKNFPYVLHTNNILNEQFREFFKEKPVIMAAAGPSLSDELDNLKKIKEDASAYIFAVGSANKTLINNGIMPDAVFSYDPQPHNFTVYQDIIDQELSSVPLVFGSSVGYKTVEKYPGNSFHMITSADPISDYLLNTQEKKINKVSDAPTIAIVTLEVIMKLGFDPVILAGQNLAFRDDDFYAVDIQNIRQGQKVKEQQQKNAVKVESVEGVEISTQPKFLTMKRHLERICRLIEDEGRKIINVTKGGAKIEHTMFGHLSNVMLDDLQTNDVILNVENIDLPPNEYEIDFVLQRLNELMKKRQDAVEIMEQLDSILSKISTFVKGESKNLKLQTQFTNLEKYISKLQKNEYFIYCINPYIKTAYQKVVRNDYKIKEGKSLEEKATHSTEILYPFVKHCLNADEDIEFLLNELKDNINTVKLET